jgi:(E)-4-hydroxy-3-methylbut-2-enyl-diphosphate synthase
MRDNLRGTHLDHLALDAFVDPSSSVLYSKSVIQRRKTSQIQLGKLKVGGDAPITVQSMTKTDTRDVRATVQQIWDLEAAGCEIVRCAVPVREAAEKLGEIKKKIRIPLVADIHFNYKLALIAIEQGVDGLRLNPGNIGARKYVEEVVKAASERKIPIRIGVNAGSLEKDLLQKYNGPTVEGMVESGLRHIRILEDVGYNEIKISLKASDPMMMIEAYRMLADKVDYPFHLGVTEAGTQTIGTIKSAVGLGTLLAEGIGDTIRVSLAADPVEEVRVGTEILKALRLKKEGLTFVACPSCGRADVDLVALAKAVEERMVPYSNLDIHVAVMGCEVNGPGEARAADLGVAGGKGIGLIFKRGEVIRKVPENEIVDALMEEVEKFAAEKKAEQAAVAADS